MTSALTSLRRIALLLLSFQMSFAGVGKIVGTVTDAENGDALAYVNIIVHELNIGASTDIDGKFIILNIPPGEYSLSATYIGYQSTRYEGVQSASGHTTVQDFKLSSAVIEGEEVVVLAKRPLVQKDLTASQKITSSAAIKAMPVESFIGVLTTQAGVNTGADGAIHIRGGRSNEVGFYIDGISVSNPFSNGLSMNVSNKSLEEMKVVSGAFNAEYGNAMSGIVNIQLKEGSENFDGSLSFYSGDYVSNNTDVFLNIDDLNPGANSVIEANLTGPIYGRKLTFNLSGKYRTNQGYLYGIREHLPGDSANFEDSDNYYIELGGDSAFVAMNPSTNTNALAKFTFRVTPKLKFSFQTLTDRGWYKSYDHAYKYNPDGIYNHYYNNGGYSFKINQSFGSSFYEASLYKNFTDASQYVYEDPFDSRYVPTSRIDGSPASATFAFGGTRMGHYYSNSSTLGAKADFTAQIGSHNEAKAGIDIKTNMLESTSKVILYDNDNFREPTILDENTSPTHVRYEGHAEFFSAYVQDKLEYESMIMNAGIRYDYFNPNADYPADLLDPQGAREDAAPKSSISPRLGVAFPITDEGILHFSYGHFYQMPSLSQLYTTSIFSANGAPSLGYSDLKPEKTVLYEFGLQQQLGEYIALEATAFYKDIRDLLAVQSIYYESALYGPASYSIRLNKDYATVKGYTMSISKPYDNRSHLSGSLDYTYQQTEGNDVSSGSFFYSQYSDEEEEKEIVFLSWDQSHLINSAVTYSHSNNWSISVIGKLSSGWPYTPNIPLANYNPKTNTERKPWQSQVDLRLNKSLKIGSLTYSLFCKIFNALDKQNERYVYDDTGRAGYTFVNRSTQETEEFKSHYGEPGIHTWSEYQVRPTYYSSPRSLFVGFSVDF
jgi:outer membrane receptor protein involved in Fe transport